MLIVLAVTVLTFLVFAWGTLAFFAGTWVDDHCRWQLGLPVFLSLLAFGLGSLFQLIQWLAAS